jgi:hypothetical protein
MLKPFHNSSFVAKRSELPSLVLNSPFTEKLIILVIRISTLATNSWARLCTDDGLVDVEGSEVFHRREAKRR